MIPKELFKKIRQIEITTSRLVSDVFAGQYHSVFKGQGIEFDEVREYQPGDDIRAIDWNVTARTGVAHIKKYIEERELTVMILVDMSASLKFSSINELKRQLAAEISSLLALAATRNNDKVGLFIVSDHIEKFVAPRKGSQHVLRMIRDVLYFEPQGKSTDIVQALEYLNKVTTRKTITFLISDFFTQNEEGLKKAMAVTNKRHDVIVVSLNDSREYDLPNCGLLKLEDAESGKVGWIDSSSKVVRKKFNERNTQRREIREKLLKSIGVDFIDVFTDKPYDEALVKFFLKRQKRR